MARKSQKDNFLEGKTVIDIKPSPRPESEKPQGVQQEESGDKKAVGSRKRGRPLKNDVVRDKASQRGLTKDWARKTFIVRCKYIQEIKALAREKSLTEKEVLDMALAKFLDVQESA